MNADQLRSIQTPPKQQQKDEPAAAQKELEDEREQLIDELQDALRKVVRLEGLLPICASCRKVRDDTGYWGNVEEYFGDRAPVEFTHGICPDCQVKLYPSIR